MKTLKDTLKDLYNEFPRNWSHVRCSENAYIAMRSGAAIRIVSEPRYNLLDLQVVVDEALNRDDVLVLYDRHHQFVRSVEFQST